MESYNATPWLDLYNQVLPTVNAMLAVPITRDAIKTTVLAKLYGMGIGLLAIRLKVDVTTAKQISDAVIGAVPGLRGLGRMLKETTGKGLPVRTWGGREYFCEHPKMVDGQMRDFHYKMINVLIQASAADDLKECILWFWRHAPRKYKLILTVHDELVVSAPAGEIHKSMALLKKAMNHVKFDVPMLSEGKYGPNMASLVEYDKKGVDVYAGKSA
jgi:DNA polymerase-1